jgi:CHAD domain-containing protein
MELDYVRLRDLKPVLSGYLQESLTIMKEADVPDEKAIHDIRVLMKKARSILKLAAPQLDNGYTDRDVASLKEVGQITRRWRETSVLRKLLKEFKKDNPDIFVRLSGYAGLNKILEKNEVLSDAGNELIESTGQINSLITKTFYRIRFQQMHAINPQFLIKELDVTYRKVVELYVACRNNPKSASLHKLRKRTKDFLYQLYIFKPLNPSKIKFLEKKLFNMTQNLGKYNDLAQIIEILNYDYRENTNPVALDELVLKIRDEQDKYLARVWPVAYQIFCPGQNLINVLGFRLLVI